MAADNRDVDQVSRPMQIALVAVVLLAGMWFAVLRPKADTATPAAPAPGTAGLSSAVDKANGAAAASDAANAATQAASGETAAAPSTDATASAPVAKAAAKPTTASSAKAKADAAGAASDKSERLLAKIADGKTVVMAFYGKGADDRAARRAVRRATEGDSRVVVGSAPIAKVGQYEAMTSGVEVLTAPTVLVIGKGREAVALTGYLDQRNVKQAIGDARRAAKSGAKK